MARRPSIAIIGTGFGGLGAAIELKKHGFDDIVILEKASDVGGVWRENTYPGAACDVPAPYYSFSFEPNPHWPRRYAEQPAILEYLNKVADKYDLRRHCRFGTEVAGADYDQTHKQWRITTRGGDMIRADILVSAVGQLSRPSWPNIEGRERFRGAAFHSAEWDHSVDLAGKRVAVIGTGASAIQFVPRIQPKVAKLSVFQRTAPYLFPRMDTEFGQLQRKMFSALPSTLLVERFSWWCLAEVLAIAFLYSKALSNFTENQCRRHLERQVKDEALRTKLWPDYAVGCKRILFSNDYFPALTQPNVDLVTDRIAAIEENGIRTKDGVLHEADVIIYGTGFAASDFLVPMSIRGRAGKELHHEWSEGARAYLGIAVKDFPNLFLMYGPNTNLGSGSIIFMHECQSRYIRQAVAYFAQTGRALSVRASVADDYDLGMQSRLVDGVWSKCTSWYRGKNGRISNNWPGTVAEYRRRTATFDPNDYEAV